MRGDYPVSASRKTAPNSASFFSPTPWTARSASRVRGFRAASRTISGIDDDGLTAEGGAADALMVTTTTAAAERGIPAADGGPASGDGSIGKVALT